MLNIAVKWDVQKAVLFVRPYLKRQKKMGGGMSLRKLAVIPVAVLGFCVICLAAPTVQDSTIVSEDLDRVFGAMQKNDWRNIEKNAAQLIQRDSPGQRYLIARLRYIYIFSLGAQLDKKMIKYADAKKKLSVVANQLIIQPWHPVDPKASPCFNKICMDSEKPSLLVTAQTNSDATAIYSFEYFDMGRPVNLTSFKGQNARLGGVLDDIEINENLEQAAKMRSGVTWYLRLHVKDGFIDNER